MSRHFLLTDGGTKCILEDVKEALTHRHQMTETGWDARVPQGCLRSVWYPVSTASEQTSPFVLGLCSPHPGSKWPLPLSSWQLFPYVSAQLITLGKSSEPIQLHSGPPESHCHIARHVMVCLSTLLLLSPSGCELEEDRTAISLCAPVPAGACTKSSPGIC